ncbi:alpha/beta hydrolase [Streptomyces botrytidirepellens]|uniref:Alpha/beta hydrolase n=1 Tax=Streptomyces botrytidirepellens TaxID=2486417 RepID=A0A3M8VL76_9ACTN|nr:alpha/beta hydrolase [Streptomyces botrytidirepellens]RNG18412.1 alpha/beta hydrolase [Streptomyces botrytidirepellens]
MATSRSSTLTTIGVAVAGAALLCSGCSVGASAPRAASMPTAVPTALKPYYEQTLTWHKCPGGAGFDCATLKAPLDYARPGAGRDLKLEVSRKKATRSARRIGSLLVNPGGPGGSAIGYLQSFAAIGYPAPVRARYDLVAMDPRGVAGSEPVTCLNNRQMDAFTRTDQTPDDPAETRRLVAAYKKFARGCAARSGRVLGHVSTVEAARDMDLLRAALGDRKLAYVGASYGTFLGATYADLYPARVGRLVLDGALDPTLTSRRMNRDQTAGFETAFTAFARDCLRRSGCPLGTGTVASARKRLGALFRRIDSHPVPTGGSRTLTESLATIGVITAMYDEGAWPQLRTALRAARRGDGKGLLDLADLYYERDTDGRYANLMYANPAVNCLDLPPAFRTPADVRTSLPAFEKASPVFGRPLAWSALNCGYWPIRPTGHPHPLRAKGAAPIVVVGTTRDPATPYRWARALASQLTSATLLTYDGDGHTAYSRGSRCVDTAINTYLLTGRPPAPSHRRCT